MTIEKKVWANSECGEVYLYTLRNGEMAICLTNYGCSVTDIIIGDKNIIAGYSNFSDLEKDKYYMGCLVGRYAGRIANASIDIDGINYLLTANDGLTGHHLHGGFNGFNRILFKEVSSHTADTFAALTFRGISQHMEEGYPGTVDLTISITLNTDNEIIFSYYAIADQPTHINLTHHLYYNLNGRNQPSDQQLQIKAEQMLQTSGDYIPTGQIVAIPEDLKFSSARKIPSNAAFNECYVVNESTRLQTVAELSNKDASLTMHIASTCPGLIFYSGQFLAAPFSPGEAICLETQYYPDSPNHDSFPSTLYDQHKTYKEFTKLSFIKAI